MFSDKTNEYFMENPQYKTSLKNDVFIPCRFKDRILNGISDYMTRFIEKIQLLDTDKWDLFVDQFRAGNVDDENGGWRGEYWGKLMRGACITYTYTQNEKLYGILKNTVLDILSTQDKLGRISTYSVEKEYHGWDIWNRKYVLLGLLHFHEICDDRKLKERIISASQSHLDYMIDTLGEGKIAINETSTFWGAANSISLLEPLMRMYNHTGEGRYLDFAHYIVKTGPKGINIFEEALRNETSPYEWSIRKAYELMSCFEGLIEYYRVTGIEKWKTAAINFAKKIMGTDVTIIGCCGCEHELFNNSTVTQTDKDYMGIMQETCVTVTWIKFCYQLLRLTGEGIFADEIEKSIYNALYGAVNTEQSKLNGGLPFDSYSPLLLNKRGRGIGGIQKDSSGNLIYGCCAAIGAAGIAMVPEIAVNITKKGVVLNLYISGEYNLITPQNDDLKLIVSTRYPADGKIKITVLPEKEQEFEIMLRIPEFSKNTKLNINSESVLVTNNFVRLSRYWYKGDKIFLDIDMASCVFHSCNNFIAVKYGPLVLARDARLSTDTGEGVDLDYNKTGSILLERSISADFPVLCEFKVPCKNGGYIKMIDYQSAGKTWNEDSLTEVWLPVNT